MTQRAKDGLTRRAYLAGAAALPLASGAARASAQPSDPAPGLPSAFPDLTEFPGIEGSYLNSGSVHPVSQGARRAVETYLASRGMNGEGGDYSIGRLRGSVLQRYADLINAEASEVAYITSTSAGEQMAVNCLGLPRRGGRIVTDVLHFFGSFHLYNELEAAGMEVVIIPMRDNRIYLEDMAAAMTPDTRLVSISAISTINGFQHDLAAVAEMAHAHGAHVYVDAVHAVGSVPVDVKASGIDFMANSSFKWMMGDMGLGFMYVRGDLIGQLERPQAGYQQLASFASHAYPYDPPGDEPFETGARDDATGLFAMGTYSNTGVAHLDWSLDYLAGRGIANIQAWRQPLIEKARREMPRLGFEPLTPEDSTGPLIAWARENARADLYERLNAAGVHVSLSRHRLRISPSVFNSEADIDRVLEALS
ncbi:aminotransferase class V-fold PLP-dependent enzyme [Maricaulis parjimensis]|uniref:aminotransferase class V-fold PLP-dependent enzyme n=1 Tax=Maricaulis parjimensis TaxID=144023 RepID=UPI00193986D2|nr:aminotransferase class V-fold PLP-dependent enzyme [Maricaulis parjimensis]